MAAMLEEKNSLEQEKAALIREGSSAQAAVAQVCMCMYVCVWMYIYMYVYTYVHVYYVLTNLPIPSSRCKYIKKIDSITSHRFLNNKIDVISSKNSSTGPM